MLRSVNPATEATIATYDEHTPDQVEAALAAAASAQRAWRATDIAERLPVLTAIARELRADRESFARLITSEMGKPITEARAEIDKSAWTLEHYAEHAVHYLAAQVVTSAATESTIVFEPLGVLLAVMPWNYPCWQFVRVLAPALAAGNGVLLKHAGNVSGCALRLAEILRRVGAPDGLCTSLLVGPNAVADLIADDRVAAHADLKAAATVAVRSRFNTTGQSCVNAKRFIVDERVADEFAGLVVDAAAALVVGDPGEETTQIGPLARADLRDALHDQVLRTVGAGGILRLGGSPVDGPGFYYPPTIIDHVTPAMAAFTEETFGPVAAVTRVSGAAEAIELANRTDYGLAATLWTTDLDEARRLVPLIDVGAVFVNGQVASDPRLPFGGIKKSGYGRELGSYGIREFVNVKTVWIGPATNT